MIDYSRLRNLNVSELLKQEIVFTSFNLAKDGEIRKLPKSELTRALKDLLEKPQLSDSGLPTILVIGFMAYARKIPTKKMRLVTYEDFFGVLW